MVESNSKQDNSGVTPKVTGIGGIFFLSKDPEATRNWYSKNLGLNTDEYGSLFEFRNLHSPDEVNYLQWSPFKVGSSYFEPSEKEFMINYRVQNIEGMLTNLMKSGVKILDEISVYDYGKFLHIMDNEGNKIELWEQTDSAFSNSEGKTA